MIRILTVGGLVAVATLVGGTMASQAQYNCDRQGRSTDPNCYRNGGYVCGHCRPGYRERGSRDDGDDRRYRDDRRPRSYGYT